jgi:hypothetical protein
MYRVETRLRIVKFLEKKKSCFISELCYLGKRQNQVKYSIVREIVEGLVRDRLVRIESIKFGRRILYRVVYYGK